MGRRRSAIGALAIINYFFGAAKFGAADFAFFIGFMKLSAHPMLLGTIGTVFVPYCELAFPGYCLRQDERTTTTVQWKTA
jgi:hypothetical protein